MPSSKTIKRICNDKMFTGRIEFIVALFISIQKYVFEYQQELRNMFRCFVWKEDSDV